MLNAARLSVCLHIQFRFLVYMHARRRRERARSFRAFAVLPEATKHREIRKTRTRISDLVRDGERCGGSFAFAIDSSSGGTNGIKRASPF